MPRHASHRKALWLSQLRWALLEKKIGQNKSAGLLCPTLFFGQSLFFVQLWRPSFMASNSPLFFVHETPVCGDSSSKSRSAPAPVALPGHDPQECGTPNEAIQTINAPLFSRPKKGRVFRLGSLGTGDATVMPWRERFNWMSMVNPRQISALPFALSTGVWPRSTRSSYSRDSFSGALSAHWLAGELWWSVENFRLFPTLLSIYHE